VWFLRCGRGYGKTRAGAEWVRLKVMQAKVRRIAIVGGTARDCRAVMIDGPSGILSVFPQSQRPNYEPTNMRIVFHNGVIAEQFSAEEPERLRGFEFGAAWCDELASWQRDEDTWTQLNLTLRESRVDPQILVTTTPRPTALIRMIRDARRTVNVTGTIFENAENLSGDYIANAVEKFGGTRLGRQELYAEILDNMEGALFNRGMFSYGTPT
jgi:phage terminase large subunit-like protein